jgi:streptogramin lyase
MGPAPAEAAPRFRLPRVRRRRPVLIGGAAAAVLAAVLVTVLVLSGGGGGKKTPTVGGVPVRVDTVIKLDPRTLKPVADIKVGQGPHGIAFSSGFLWVINDDDGTISQIDPQNGDVVTKGGVSSPCGFLSTPRSLWVFSCQESIINHIDPTDLSVDHTMQLPDGASVALLDHGVLWVGTDDDSAITPDYIYKYRLGSTTPVDRFRVGSAPGSMAVGLGSLWVGSNDDGTVERIDPTTDRRQQILQGWTGPADIQIGFGAVWIVDDQDDSITELNAGTNHVTAKLQEVEGGLFIGQDSVWSVDAVTEDVWRIDPETGTVSGHTVLPYGDTGVYADGYVWITGPAD